MRVGGGVGEREEVEVRGLVGVLFRVADLEEDDGGLGRVVGEVEGYGDPKLDVGDFWGRGYVSRSM